MEIIANNKPENFTQPSHSNWIFERALVDKRHGLGIVSMHADTFVHPRGAPATGREKNWEKLQIVNI